MTSTIKISLPAPVADRFAERTVPAPRFVCSVTSLPILPAAMGNRAFIRAWAARRASVTVRRGE